MSPAALRGTKTIYLGHELIGEVTEVGSGVTTLKVGDRVIHDSPEANCLNQEIQPLCRHCHDSNHALGENSSLGRGPRGMGGGWGDSFTVHETGVDRVPEELDDETALMIEPLSVGVRAALRCLPRTDQRVLVVGSGMIGLAVVDALRALSPACHITAMAGYPHQVEMVRKLGAQEIITREDPYISTARITDRKLYIGQYKNRMILGGTDVVYDCVGSDKTLQDSLGPTP